MLRILFLFLIIGSSLVKLQAQDVSYTPPSMKYDRFVTLKDFLFRYAYYPAQFVKEGREANIDITLRICKDGSVCLIDLKGFNADIFEKHLTRELIKTDKRWKPAMLNGIAIDTIVKQKILYTLYSTQDYLNDSTIVEKGGGEAINYDHNGAGKRTTNSFSKTMVNNLRDYYNPKGEKVKYGEYILWRRPGYDFFAEAEQFFTDSNYVEAIKNYMLAEQKGFMPYNLFTNRAQAFFMVNKPVLGCRDLLRIKGLNPEIDKVIEENCFIEKVVEKPLEKGTF